MSSLCDEPPLFIGSCCGAHATPARLDIHNPRPCPEQEEGNKDPDAIPGNIGRRSSGARHMEFREPRVPGSSSTDARDDKDDGKDESADEGNQFVRDLPKRKTSRKR